MTRLKYPLTGLFRAINENAFRQVAINFRHDVPQTDWASGWGIDHFAQTPGFRLDQKFPFFNTPGEVAGFVEHTNMMGLTVRGSVDHLLGPTTAFPLTSYTDRRPHDMTYTVQTST